MALIEKYMRKWETDKNLIEMSQNNFNTGDQTDAKDVMEKPAPQYKSCIDFIYLFWKALDFEQMFEFTNQRDENDTISKLIEYINETNT